MENVEIIESKIEKMMKTGLSDSFIKEHLLQEYPDSTDSFISHVIEYVKDTFINSQFTGLNEILAIHLHRYNNRIQQLLLVQDPDDLPDEERKLLSSTRYYAMRQRKIRAMNDMLNTLIQKEELLQYHNEGFEIEINNEETIEIKGSNPEIDISKLTLVEQVELLELFKKAKVGYTEIHSVTKVGDHQNIIDTECEVEGVEPNINQIKLEESTEIENFLPFKTDPQSKIFATVDRLAVKSFHEAGATLTDEELKFLK